MAGRVFQILEAVNYGDAASSMAFAFAPFLAAQGVEPALVSLHAHEALRDQTRPFESIVWRDDDAVIVHLVGHTRLQRFLASFPGRKAIYFHNITPPEFFTPGTFRYRETRAGWLQLPRVADLADVWLAPSAYNLAVLGELGVAPRPGHVVPPPIDPQMEQARPADERRLAGLRAEDEVNFLFVGRLAPHKAQARVMEVFDYYHTRINRRSRLHLVGGPCDPVYARGLAALRDRLASAAAIELPGKVSDAELVAYYRAADLFLCLSEHEGFCLPPLIAAAHGVPVLARATSALPETIGPAVVLLHEYDPARIAELAHLVLQDLGLRERLHRAATHHLTRFTPDLVKEAWALALAKLGQEKRSH